MTSAPPAGLAAGRQDEAAEPVADRPRRRRPLSRTSAVAVLFFLGPWIVGFVGLTVIPMIASFYYSLTDYSLFGDYSFVGFDNYVEMFTDDARFRRSMKATFTYVFFSSILKLAFALGVALLLRYTIRARGYYRSAYYLPSVIGGSVAVAILWRQVFGANGIVDSILTSFGLPSQNYVSSPETAIWTMIALAAWQFGAPMIIFLAALHQIPVELYEAATVDGAGPVRQFFSITLPLLSPFVLFNGVMQIIGSFQSFTPAFIISNGTGGPVDSTLVMALYLYDEAFTQFNMGYASAMAWVLLVFVAIATLLLFRSSRRWVFTLDGDRS